MYIFSDVCVGRVSRKEPTNCILRLQVNKKYSNHEICRSSFNTKEIDHFKAGFNPHRARYWSTTFCNASVDCFRIFLLVAKT